MTDKQIEIELAKLNKQSQQWQDDYDQRDHHWLWQRVFWLITGVAVIIGATITLTRIFLL